jgi:hypothetical protein
MLCLTHKSPRDLSWSRKSQVHKISCDFSKCGMEGLINCAHGTPVELPTLLVVMRISDSSCFFGRFESTLSRWECRSRFLDWYPLSLAGSPRAIRPLYTRRRFIQRRLVTFGFAKLRPYSEFARSLEIKLPGNRQILSLLKSADARSGSQTDDTIDPASIAAFVLQNLLHPIYIFRIRDRWCLVTGGGSRSCRPPAWSRDPWRHQ